jgi:hypothetical protein
VVAFCVIVAAVGVVVRMGPMGLMGHGMDPALIGPKPDQSLITNHVRTSGDSSSLQNSSLLAGLGCVHQLAGVERNVALGESASDEEVV